MVPLRNKIRVAPELRLALYHPQIPQNTGTLLRLSYCLGIPIDLIRPFGFITDDKKLKRAGAGCVKFADYGIHDTFEDFLNKYKDVRTVALDVGENAEAYYSFRYKPGDILIVGSEHYGFLKGDLAKITHRVKIPMLPGRRSLNMAVAAAMVLSEAISRLNLHLPLSRYEGDFATSSSEISRR
ncbi:MAG: tRNA methyltransferase [Holosporaceae bacterium]|jgi:tRNA (cytidine/uridine-2'-O-)-methyltransferase|nr:tRNA methyltransferase [Holosporaceae bacterium]